MKADHMAREINLLTEKQILSAQEQELRRKIAIWVPFILGILVVSLGVVLGSRFYLSRLLSQTGTGITREKNRIGELEKNEGMYLILKQKATALSQIINSHYPYHSLFQFIKTLEYQTDPNSAKITSVVLAETGEVKLETAVSDTEKLDRFISQLLQEAQVRFERVELVSVAVKQDAGYEIILDIETASGLARAL